MKSTKLPILSICIPTYNRAEYLKLSIESIIQQEIFQKTNKVEIIISDNCSDDNTEKLCSDFVDLYYPKIKYYRNKENIMDKNFEKVLSYGTGIFLKLSNDTLLYLDKSIEYIIEIIKKNEKERNILFFSNSEIRNIDSVKCYNLNDFVKPVSSWSTWIACFGIWKENLKEIDNFSRYAHLQFVQTDVLFRLITQKKNIYVDNKEIFNVQPLKSKGGYNVFSTFGINYLFLYDEYLKAGILCRKIYKREKYKLFKYHLKVWYKNIVIYKDKSFYFDKSNSFNILMVNYKYEPYFYLTMLYMYIIYIMKLVYLRLFGSKTIYYKITKHSI